MIQDEERLATCCLLESDEPCLRAAGNAVFNKRVQKNAHQTTHLSLKPRVTHKYMCDYHKHHIMSMRRKKTRDSDDEPEGDDNEEMPQVDLSVLQLNTLRKFKKHYKIPSRPGLNKAQLVELLTPHFVSLPVCEKDVLTHFIYNVKNGRAARGQATVKEEE